MARGKNDIFKPGDWNIIDDLTGFKEKASRTVKRWDGIRVKREYTEERHPVDFLRGIPDNMGVPFARVRTVTYADQAYANPDPFISTLSGMSSGL